MTAGGGSLFGAAARNSSQFQAEVGATCCHFGSAAASASSDGAFPSACWIPTHVWILRLTSVAPPFAPTRANGSPWRPSTTTGVADSFLTKTAGTTLADTTLIVTPGAGSSGDFWTMA